MRRPSQISTMLEMAKVISNRSTCSRLKVGCIITNTEISRIEGMGYNGGARGLENNCESLKPGMCGHVHAEINALIKSSYELRGKKMFLTHSPCINCAKAIINGRIEEVYFLDLYIEITILSSYYIELVLVFILVLIMR